MNEFPPKYEPQGIEKKWYDLWMESGFFTPDPESEKPPYTIMIPLPNVTGRLTLGHVLNNSLQDILIRYKKLCGYNTLWMMGMDHAGIATQVVVEERLLEKGIGKHTIDFFLDQASISATKEEKAQILEAVRREGRLRKGLLDIEDLKDIAQRVMG